MKIKENVNDQTRIYSPNSIYHGSLIHSNSAADNAILLKMQVDRLTDFIEFLFEHSEHCDHISHREAWKEFEIYEIKNSYYRKEIQKQRAELRASIK